MNLADTVKPLGAAFWRSVGNSAVRMIKDITASGRGVDNQAFEPYSQKYEERKVARKFRRQASTSARPDLRLTGDMMRDLRTLQVTAAGVDLGWSVHGDRVYFNAEGGRAIIDFDSQDEPLHENVMTSVFAAVNAERGRLWDKWASEPVDIPIKR